MTFAAILFASTLGTFLGGLALTATYAAVLHWLDARAHRRDLQSNIVEFTPRKSAGGWRGK